MQQFAAAGAGQSKNPDDLAGMPGEGNGRRQFIRSDRVHADQHIAEMFSRFVFLVLLKDVAGHCSNQVIDAKRVR